MKVKLTSYQICYLNNAINRSSNDLIFTEGLHGKYGVNCSNNCLLLTYGRLCSKTCNCSNSSCHQVYGCTGISCKYQDYLVLNQIYFKQSNKQTKINRKSVSFYYTFNL